MCIRDRCRTLPECNKKSGPKYIGNLSGQKNGNFGPGGLPPKFDPRSPVSLASQLVPKGWQATAQKVRVTRAQLRRNLNFSKNVRQPIAQKQELMNFGLDIFPEAVAEFYVV